MKVLLLGGNKAEILASWLEEQGETVLFTCEPVTSKYVKNYGPDIIVSYNYRFLLKPEIIVIPPHGAINLHISFLPYNRGADPNPWSFLEDTPSGVTIHYIDEGIDTGDILIQKRVQIDEQRETLRSSYEKLHTEIQKLFYTNWEKIRNAQLQPIPQIKDGTIHYMKNRHKLEAALGSEGWDVSIPEFKRRYSVLTEAAEDGN